MFDHVVLRRAEGGDPINAGKIAEALLFYQKVHLVIDRATLFELIRQIGASGLLSLISRSDFSAVYTDEILATITNSVGVSKCHAFVAITLSGNQLSGKLDTPQERLQHDLEQAGILKSDSKKIAKALLQRIPVRKMSGNHYVVGGIPKAAESDLQDTVFMNGAFSKIVSHMPGGYDPGDTIKVEIIKGEQGYFVFDNVDYAKINASRASMAVPLETMTVAHVLTQVQEARADLALAAHYGGDIVTSTAVSSVLRLKYDMLLNRTVLNTKNQQSFAEVVLTDMPTVAEQVNSGARSFQEFLLLLDKSAKFKEWLKSTNPDEGLTREYLHAVSSQDWIQTPKAKGMRYLVTLALDSTNPIAGFAAGFADNFLVEKILGGWRPNHFIEQRLTPFLISRK